LAEAVIRTFAPVPDPRTPRLRDRWYTGRRLWRAARARGGAITGGLKANRKLRVEVPGEGRVYRSRATYAVGLTADDFREVAGPHEDGPARPVYTPRGKRFVRHLGAGQGLIVRERLDQPLQEVRSWATAELAADLASGVGGVAQRWTIEQCIADVTEEFGTDHEQIRAAQGSVRFWHLAFLGYLSLEEEPAQRQFETGEPELSIGQTRGGQQDRHQRLLLDWIGARYAENLPSEPIHQPLAA
jgi:hypothetical protein